MVEAPQMMTVHGRRAAVVVAAGAFDALTKPRMSFADFRLTQTPGPKRPAPNVRPGPWPDDVVDLINDRGTDTGRGVAF
jgi:hypothetical protein